MQGAADVEGEEVVGGFLADAVEDVIEGLFGFEQAFVMAEVGDYCVAGFESVQVHDFKELLAEGFQVFLV